MATVPSVLTLGPEDHGRPLTAEEFAEVTYAEPWKNEREQGGLTVMPPDGPGHDDCSEPIRDHLGAYRLYHPDVVDEVASGAWIPVDERTDRIADIGVFLDGARSTIARPRRVPEVVFEIVSPDRESRERDYVLKRKEYANLGVLEYLVVDRMRHRATADTAGPQGFRKRILRRCDVCSRPLLPGLTIPLSDIL